MFALFNFIDYKLTTLKCNNMKYILTLLLILLKVLNSSSQTFVNTKVIKESSLTSEAYQSLTFNGSWCWFSDPRAVYYEGKHKRTYSGWVDNYGDIHVGYYDHDTKEIRTKVVYDNLEIDDHDNPSILFDEKGHLLVFFNTHTIGVKPLYLIKSTLPEDIDNWGKLKELALNDPANKQLGSMTLTYTNPVKLTSEQGKIYLFWRGIDGKPSYSVSTDNGENWSLGKIFFMPDRDYSFRRPYTKIKSNGKDKIHFVLTDGHPRNEDNNNIYYMYYKNGAFYRANGTKIKNIGGEPIKPIECDLVYDATKGNAKGWNWDIAEDKSGNPVIAYTRYPNDETHIYALATYSNGKWKNEDLVNSGSWFPESLDNIKEPEPNYSGGMSIDQESTNTLYLSVKRDSFFEIEKWTSVDGKWNIEQLTKGSSKNNIRPFAIRNAQEGNPLQVLWMQNTKYHHFAYGNYLKQNNLTFNDRFQTAIKMNLVSPTIIDPMDKDQILNIMRQTADWQLANPKPKISRTDWHYGALYTGIRALHDLTGEQRYKDEMINIGQSKNWKPMDDIFHADRLVIIDNWAWLYGIHNDPKMIDKSKWAMDIHLARNYKRDIDLSHSDNPYFKEWWTWCDALYMAPPSFVAMWKVTGETKYLDYMNTMWWKTSDYIYSPQDSLYYRDDRFIPKRSENDKKIMWARGNGWVIGGLSRILGQLPSDYIGRARFEQQYKEMAHKLLSIQDQDGLWRVSLLDPEYLDQGESSGSAFNIFGLAWGINNGLIDKKYQPQIEKAWVAICKNVTLEGKLGFVQQVAGDPFPFKKEEWHVYATGAFLLAGKEMYLMKK